MKTTETESRSTPASPARREILKPRNTTGAAHFAAAIAVTAVGVWLGSRTPGLGWALGQAAIAVAFTQWFCLLHECGHYTLFRSRWLNAAAGHVAGFFALIPRECWRQVHGLHHRWTGWQDLDPTTEALSRKPRSRVLLGLANFCWRWWVPLFSVVYRLSNYWHLPRLRRFFPETVWRRLVWHAGIQGLVYLAVLWAAGAGRVLQTAGVGVALGLMFQDIFLLSQHTHVPQRISGGRDAVPFPAREQEMFTRSLRFPNWFSRWVLIRADAHALHHKYPRVAGYHLDKLPRSEAREIPWWGWTLAARRIPAEVFLFQNRDETGHDI